MDHIESIPHRTSRRWSIFRVDEKQEGGKVTRVSIAFHRLQRMISSFACESVTFIAYRG